MDTALVLCDECSTSKEGEVLPTVSGGEPCARGVLGPDVETGVETYDRILCSFRAKQSLNTCTNAFSRFVCKVGTPQSDGIISLEMMPP